MHTGKQNKEESYEPTFHVFWNKTVGKISCEMNTINELMAWNARKSCA